MFEGVQELPRTFSVCLRGYDAEEKDFDFQREPDIWLNNSPEPFADL